MIPLDDYSHGRGGVSLIDHNNLEEFADPINYDLADPSDTGVAFYSALARETGGPVLELACGTGRVTIPISRSGFAVTGLDIVPGMLERARSKATGLPVRWVEGDARSFDLGEKFRLIFVTGNAFQAFVTNAEQSAVLRCVHAHLHSDGLFAFEIRNPLLPNAMIPPGFFLTLETRSEQQTRSSFINADGNQVRIATTQVYDHVEQVVHVTAYKRWTEGAEERTTSARTALRYTFPQELALLLNCHGFTVLRQYGDWNGEPLTAVSPSIISVCQKRPARFYPDASPTVEEALK
ncbi:MAG: class I SAM-dependent methyltransferase [Spirochaetaceae bacterium]|nr:MAG: class I SAM-dependent methyltransferase [Spirochaetaceae bacterium]